MEEHLCASVLKTNFCKSRNLPPPSAEHWLRHAAFGAGLAKKLLTRGGEEEAVWATESPTPRDGGACGGPPPMRTQREVLPTREQAHHSSVRAGARPPCGATHDPPETNWGDTLTSKQSHGQYYDSSQRGS